MVAADIAAVFLLLFLLLLLVLLLLLPLLLLLLPLLPVVVAAAAVVVVVATVPPIQLPVGSVPQRSNTSCCALHRQGSLIIMSTFGTPAAALMSGLSNIPQQQ